MVLDVQQVVRSFDEKSRAVLEIAQTGADARRAVCPQALAIPTQQPMDSFDARTWPASYVEWWYGDGAPNLDRQRPMLIEEVARRVINIEELEYAISTDDHPYEASCQSRFNTPEIIAVLGDVVRRLRLLKGTRAAIGRKGFSADLKVLATATTDDFMEAMHIAKPRESITTAVARADMPAKVKTALRTLLLSTSDVPGTEGRKTTLRFDGHGNNLLFGAATFFNTPNFADTCNPLILQLHEGPGQRMDMRSRSAAQPAVPPEITRAEPKMPSLERMHQIGAKDPRAQAKFFILMTELHYRFVIGLERLHIGRLTLAQPRVPVHDEVAASLQPCVTPGTTDVQAPFEAQGRGFEHGHGKGHGIVGSTMRWLRKSVVDGLPTAAQKLRQAALSMAETIQYESARESGKQMDVHDIPPEPFTMKQQRQTRMDGGEDEDGSLREYVEIGPPVVQPHIEREQDRAAAQNRTPLTGSAAYRDLPLTGALQSTFPLYRQRFSFGILGSAIQPAAGDPPYRSDADLFSIGEDGEVRATLMPDGTEASQEAIESDAAAWASHFGWDSFNNHCTNHEHNCTETCVKYVKQKLEAKLSLRSNKVPSCRFWYFRVKKLNLKRVRRRGKPLVAQPYVEETDDRNQQFRCQLKRETPLRSTSNDVCQVTDRCNVDFQCLVCVPALENDAPQLVPGESAPRKRLFKKTKDITKSHGSTYKGQRGVKWLYACNTSQFDVKLLNSFSAAFRKAYAMDFYITKYQGKMMESLTPLFQTMTTGMQRLEQQEKEEAVMAQLARDGGDLPGQTHTYIYICIFVYICVCKSTRYGFLFFRCCTRRPPEADASLCVSGRRPLADWLPVASV